MNTKYYASDLDGTIVKEIDFLISKETENSILKFQDFSKNSFFIVTGRSYTMTKKYIKDLNVNLPCIVSNGSIIINPLNEDILYANLMDRKFILEIIDYAIKHNLDISFHAPTFLVSTKNDERINKYKEVIKKWENEYEFEAKIYDNLIKLKEAFFNNEFQVVKVLISLCKNTNETIIKNIHDFAESRKMYHPFTYIHSRILIDIMPKGINKAFGIKKWSELMKCNYDEITTFGDNLNDLEMNKLVKYGLCVDNAVDELKRVSYKIIGSIENNGVGIYLEEIIKNNE